MRRTAALAALVLCSLLAAAVALAGPPRLEQKRLRAADMALAKRITLRPSDLAAGWAPRPATKLTEELPRCPGADLDFSAFTITGRAQSKFGQREAEIETVVEVFENRSDAVGDFRKGGSPKVLNCLAQALRKQGINVGSVRMLGRPTIGERALAFRIVMSVSTTRVYMDVVGVQRGRSIVGLYFTGTRPIQGRLAVAKSIAARMR